MKKILALSLFLLCSISILYAQMPPRPRTPDAPGEKFSDRLYFGGSFGLQFGTQTFVEVAPIIGYRVTDRLSTGLGLKYQYYKFNEGTVNYSSNTYGGGPFAQFIVYEGLFLHAEFEVLSIEVPDYYYLKYTRQSLTSVFLGGGYRQMIGERSSLDFLLLYNVNETYYTPYSNPIIRIGFGFGI